MKQIHRLPILGKAVLLIVILSVALLGLTTSVPQAHASPLPQNSHGTAPAHAIHPLSNYGGCNPGWFCAWHQTGARGNGTFYNGLACGRWEDLPDWGIESYANYSGHTVYVDDDFGNLAGIISNGSTSSNTSGNPDFYENAAYVYIQC